jgi:non-ribosomal peptide synthetase component E (peptide arylation enzyme)
MCLQVPTRIKAMAAIPRNAMGKVNKKTLRAVFDHSDP